MTVKSRQEIQRDEGRPIGSMKKEVVVSDEDVSTTPFC